MKQKFSFRKHFARAKSAVEQNVDWTNCQQKKRSTHQNKANAKNFVYIALNFVPGVTKWVHLFFGLKPFLRNAIFLPKIKDFIYAESNLPCDI